jgi:2-keto-4-pentenoate hydratase/2-oxohepta-3-ene-1,7-dioic acid hydratase in catechol pathway
MKLCRFDDDRLGLVSGDTLREVTAALETLPALRWPLPRHDPLVAHLQALRPAIEAAARVGPALPLAGRSLHSPVASPGKIVAVRQNYAGGAIGPPDLFLKASSSLTGPGSGVILPPFGRPCSVEIELAAVVGATCRCISAAEAPRYVAGYCIALDLSLVGDEDRGLRKSADTFCVLGPWLTTADEVDPATGLHVELRVNGHVAQQGCSDDMRHGVAELVASASAWFTLQPGDVLLTGSPAGGTPLAAGDLLECRIDGLGSMSVQVQAGLNGLARGR